MKIDRKEGILAPLIERRFEENSFFSHLFQGLDSATSLSFFFWSMTVAYPDSRPTLYVVSPWWISLGSVLFGPRRTGFVLPWTTYRVDGCLRKLLSCFIKRMSALIPFNTMDKDEAIFYTLPSPSSSSPHLPRKPKCDTVSARTVKRSTGQRLRWEVAWLFTEELRN